MDGCRLTVTALLAPQEVTLTDPDGAGPATGLPGELQRAPGARCGPRDGHAVPLALLALAAASLAVLPAATGAPGHGQARGELVVTLLHTSDEHSTLLPAPFVEYRAAAPGATYGGFARLMTAVEEERARKAAAGEPVLLTSAGDNIGDSPFTWLILDGEAAELGLMVDLGYDVITLGNHEFDYGSDRLADYMAVAGYPAAAERTTIVATNTLAPPDHPLAGRGLRRTHLVTLPNGLRLGFLGLLGEGAARFTPLAAPVEFTDATEAAASAVAELRDAGAHIVVAITHAGLREDRALARAVAGIDVILGGHDHLLLEEPVIEAGTLIVHPGSHLRHVARLELGYDRATGAVRVRNPETGAPYLVPLDASVAESPAVAARVADYRHQLETRIAELTGGRVTDLRQPVVRSGFTLAAARALEESPLGNFVTDAMRAAAEAATGERVDFAFQATGVIRSDVAPGTSPWNRDEIAFYDLASAVGTGSGPDGQPGSPLVSLWLTGDEVRRVLEVSVLLSELMGSSYYIQVAGLRARYDPRRAVLARVPVRGTPIPSGRAVLAAERVVADAHGTGVRGEGESSVALERGDPALYHTVTDHYVASFLPMVGRIVPRLVIEPRDRRGVPIGDLDDAIIRRDGEELKVWQAVLDFAAVQPAGEDGHPRVPAYYAAPADRLVVVRAAPIWLWIAAPLALILALLVGLVLARRRRS